jgi:hypothetical protein
MSLVGDFLGRGLEVTPIEKIVSRQIVHNFAGNVTIAVPTPDNFPTWQVNGLSRDTTRYPVSFSNRRGIRPQPIKCVETGVHSAAFPPCVAVSALRTIVAVSTNVDLKNGPAVGDLSANYDDLTESAQISAKAALLNLFAVLTDEQEPIDKVPWFTYVRKFVRIDQERFVAEVEPTLFENVQTVLNGLNNRFKGRGYFTEPEADLLLHLGNIPPQYGGSSNINKMITLKKEYEQGDLQLTLAFMIVAGRAVHLLDCDLDENRNTVLHVSIW